MNYPGFISGSYESQAFTADAEMTVNWFLEQLESEGATQRRILCPTPGFALISEYTQGPGRAHFFKNGREFAIIGSALVEIDINGTMTNRGSVKIDENPATINTNGAGGDQLFITSGENGYCYDLTANTLTQVTALTGKATIGGYCDSYFLALDANTSTLYLSNLLDGSVWQTGLVFAQRSLAPDPWISMSVNGRYVWLFGEETSEIWNNTGNASFAFEPYPSGFIPYGIAAPYSFGVRAKDTMWLATSRDGGRKVCRAAGFAPEVVSDAPRETVFGKYRVVTDCVADSYQEEGHSFFMLSFPQEDATWCWDSSTGKWHFRGTWVPEQAKFTIQRPRWHALAFGEHRWLDATSGALYRMSSTIGTDIGGQPIRRVRRAPALDVENQRIYYASFELGLDVGVGLEDGQGSDPQVMMRSSNDGGRTWTSERMRSAGKIGEYSRRVRWNRCGSGRKRVFEVSVSDPIPWRITNAYLRLGQQPEGVQPEGGQSRRSEAEAAA